MLDRLLTLKDFCNKHEKEKDFKQLQMSPEMWTHFHSLSKTPAGADTKNLQNEQLSVSDAVYHWLSVIAKLKVLKNSANENSISKRLAEKLLEPVEVRCKGIADNNLILAGWFLDKKMSHAQTLEQTIKAKDFVTSVARKLIVLEPSDDIDEVNDSNANDVPLEGPLSKDRRESSDCLDSFLDDLGKEHVQDLPPTQQMKEGRITVLKKELDVYERLPRIMTSKLDSLKWWSERKEKFPMLSRIALIILSVPVTEVSVERMFSHLKIVLSDRRTNMSSDLVEAIVFLRLNKKFSESQKTKG